MAFFNHLTIDAENCIFSFSAFKDLVTFSGVNRAAYTKFDNEGFFGRVFKELYPVVESILKLKSRADKIFPSLSDYTITNTNFFQKHTNNNCWKVCCCVFQTGQLNFSKSFINEVVFRHDEFLKAEQKDLTKEMKEICGPDDTDPTSWIHQAWLDHEKTCHLLRIELHPEQSEAQLEDGDTVWAWTAYGKYRRHSSLEDLSSYFDTVIGDRMEEFRALAEKTHSEKTETIFKEWINFDERFIPVVNYFRYKLLKLRKESIPFKLIRIDQELNYIEYLKQKITKDESFVYETEKNALSNYFPYFLENYLWTIFAKTTAMNEEDRRALFSTFEIYLKCVCSSKLAFDLPEFCNQVAVASFAPCYPESPEADVAISNHKDALQILQTVLINKAIESYLKQPLTIDVMGAKNQATQIKNLCLSSPTLYPSIESIHELFIRAIFRGHKIELLSNNGKRSLDEMTYNELVSILANYSCKEMAARYACRPLEAINESNYRSQISKLSGNFPTLTHEQIIDNLASAIRAKHGNQGFKNALEMQEDN